MQLFAGTEDLCLVRWHSVEESEQTEEKGYAILDTLVLLVLLFPYSLP